MNAPTVSRGGRYDDTRQFTWRVPPLLNLGRACADNQPPSAPAIIEYDRGGARRTFSFGRLSDESSRLAAGLTRGLPAGSRVGILIPQSFVAAVAHLAVYKAGLIAVPLSQLFGPDAIRHRLGDSGASLLIVHSHSVDAVADIAAELSIDLVVADADDVPGPHSSLQELMSTRTQALPETAADAPAFIIYTSGTTAEPKGALHAQRSLIGHLPGFELSHSFFPVEGDVFWTPADWAWIGGLMDALLPSLYFGRPVVATPPGRFDPEVAVALMRDCGVRNAFLPPTALRLIRQSGVGLDGLSLRTVMSGGESLDPATLEWFHDRTGVTIAEIYGQTEANYLVGNSPQLYDVKPGSMGRPYPGHEVALLDGGGSPVANGAVGEISVLTPDPVAFVEYWQRPDATRDKFIGRWLRTGDLALADDEGYLWFKGRADDLIISSGYRIAPVEVEASLLKHEGVAACAVVGVADELRGQVVKAFVVKAPGVEVTSDDLRAYVKYRLAAYEAPREIEFVDELPLTVTGKIRRRDLAARSAVPG